MRSRWLLVTLAGLLLAADAPNGEVRKELDRFQGTWKFVSLEAEGKKVPEADFRTARLVLEGNKFTFTDDHGTYHGTFAVDLKQKPKAIDVTFTDGPDEGKTCLGVYELEGDTYKVCIGLVGKDRPQEFASRPGSGHVLEVLRREKEKNKK